MGKLDRAKEYIGALKVYLGFTIAMILSIGAGISKLYLDNETGILFWSGILAFMSCLLVFITVARHMHKKINELEEME